MRSDATWRGWLQQEVWGCCVSPGSTIHRATTGYVHACRKERCRYPRSWCSFMLPRRGTRETNFLSALTPLHNIQHKIAYSPPAAAKKRGKGSLSQRAATSDQNAGEAGKTNLKLPNRAKEPHLADDTGDGNRLIFFGRGSSTPLRRGHACVWVRVTLSASLSLKARFRRLIPTPRTFSGTVRVTASRGLCAHFRSGSFFWHSLFFSLQQHPP